MKDHKEYLPIMLVQFWVFGSELRQLVVGHIKILQDLQVQGKGRRIGVILAQRVGRNDTR